MPEHDEQGRYCVRVWTFFGQRERCVKWHAHEPFVKASNTVERTPLEPPRGLRVWRERLGFDFGKFDYVVHEGKELLLDANRTPSFPTEQSPNVLAAAADLAQGVEGFLASGFVPEGAASSGCSPRPSAANRSRKFSPICEPGALPLSMP